MIVSLIIVTILVVIASVAGVIIYIRISCSKNANWCTTVRGVTREDTETVHQPAVYETIPEELVQTFTKHLSTVKQVDSACLIVIKVCLFDVDPCPINIFSSLL